MRVLKIETKRAFGVKLISIMILFLLLSLYVFQMGIEGYKNRLRLYDDFSKVERIKAEKSINQINSGLKGLFMFKSIYMQSPVSAMSQHSGLYDTLICSIDNTGVILTHNNRIENSIFMKNSNMSFDLSGLNLVIPCLLVAIFGYLCFKDKELITFYLNYGSKKNIFFQLFLSRFIYIFITMLLQCALVFLFFSFNNIKLASNDEKCIVVYYITMILILIMFFSVGGVASFFKNRFWSATFISIVWLSFIFLIPKILDDISMSLIPTYSNSKHESRKQDILSDFQKRLFIEAKKLNNRKDQIAYLKKRAKLYAEIELKEIKEIEKEMISTLSKNIEKKHLVNTFFPITFYDGLVCEMSSKGGLGYLSFYKHNNRNQELIVKNYTLNKPINYDDFNYVSKSSFPIGFLKGIALTFLYSLLSVIVLFFSYKKTLFPRVKKDFSNIELKVEKGEYVFFNVGIGIDDFSNKIVNAVFNKESFDANITIDNKNFLEQKIFYLPDLKRYYGDLDFEKLVIMFPEIMDYDLLLLDRINMPTKSDLGPALFELSTEIHEKEYSRYVFIVLEGNKYRVDIERDNKKK